MLKKILFYYADQVNPYKNIALEYDFFKTCPDDALFVYLWSNDKTVVIGKNQNVFNEVNVNALYEDGGVLARRLTGGGAVYHDVKNLNFTFIARDDYYDVKKQFCVIAQSLEPFGLKAEVSGRNDMTVDGKKFSGNAFLHEGGKSMHHGTILIDTDVSKMSRYLVVSAKKLDSKGVKSVASRVVNLSSLNPSINVADLAQSIKNAAANIYGLPIETVSPDDYRWDKTDEFTKKIQSKEWLFNKVTDDCDFVLKDRFDWGCVEVAYRVDDDGKITSVSVFTDSLDPKLSALAENELAGKKISLLTSSNPAVCDIIRLIKNQAVDNS